MFLSKNKKNNVYPCKPGSELYRHVFVMIYSLHLSKTCLTCKLSVNFKVDLNLRMEFKDVNLGPDLSIRILYVYIVQET